MSSCATAVGIIQNILMNVRSDESSCLSTGYSPTTVISVNASAVMDNEIRNNKNKNKTTKHQDQHHQMQQKRKVGFVSHCLVVDIPSCSEMSNQRRQELWWTRQEIKSIRELEQNITRAKSRWCASPENDMHRNLLDETDTNDENNNFSSRLGLNSAFQEERRAKAIRTCRKAVLRESERQRTVNVSLPEFLSVASRKCSRPSRREAMERATNLVAALFAVEQHPQQHEEEIGIPCFSTSQRKEEDYQLPLTTAMMMMPSPPMRKNKKSRRLLSSLSPPRSPLRKRAISRGGI